MQLYPSTFVEILTNLNLSPVHPQFTIERWCLHLQSWSKQFVSTEPKSASFEFCMLVLAKFKGQYFLYLKNLLHPILCTSPGQHFRGFKKNLVICPLDKKFLSTRQKISTVCIHQCVKFRPKQMPSLFYC